MLNQKKALAGFAVLAVLLAARTASADVCVAVDTTRDTLSDLNRQNKFSATKYNSIKTVAASDAEATCTANLALSGGGSVEYDYRIFKEDSKVKVLITDIRK